VLQEAVLGFIAQANGPELGQRAAVYEFNYLPVLERFKAAAESGADVRSVCDRRGKLHLPKPGRKKRDRVREATEAAVAAADVAPNMIPRMMNSAIVRTKFIVLLESGQPRQVSTGSTNFTWGGIFGQTNVGHAMRDAAVAQAYLNCCIGLPADPHYATVRSANGAASPQPPDLPPPGITPGFFPREDPQMMDQYVVQAAHVYPLAGPASQGVNQRMD
jgi:hypothetical protein